MAGIKSIAQFIPGTQSRADRLLKKSLRKRAKGADTLVWVEYPDGDVRLKRANWDGELNAWETEGGKRFYPRGKGGDPKMLGGAPIIQCHAEDAGVISSEAALISSQLEEGLVAPVDAEGRVLGPASNGDGSHAQQHLAQAAREQADGERSIDWNQFADEEGVDPDDLAATDGGRVPVADYVPLYDGVEFALSDAVWWDPFPVREEDARQAAEWHEMAGRDEHNLVRYILYGAVGATVIIGAMIGFIWLLGQVGSGDDTGITLTIAAASLFAAGPSITALFDRVATRFSGVKPWGLCAANRAADRGDS